MVVDAGVDDIQKVVEIIKTFSDRYHIFLLQAEVGMGKSFLVNCFCKNFNASSSSPTFSFIHEYATSRGVIYHYDLYLKNDKDSKMKLLESLQNEGLHFIEWGDRDLFDVLRNYGFDCLLINISDKGEARRYEFMY